MYNEDYETFTKLQDIPKCDHLSQGRKLLRRLESSTSRSSRRMLTVIMKGLSLPDQGKILEIGPGCCQFALEFCLRGFQYCGYDMVQQNLAVWHILKSQFGLEGDVSIQDICTVEAADKEGYYDGILAMATFEHIHDQSRALHNCYKLLRVGGRIVIIDDNLLDPRTLLKMTFVRKDGGIDWLFTKGKVYENYGSGWKGKCEDVKSIFWWGKNLRDHGFSIVSLTTAGALRRWVRLTGLWSFAGNIIAVGEKD